VQREAADDEGGGGNEEVEELPLPLPMPSPSPSPRTSSENGRRQQHSQPRIELGFVQPLRLDGSDDDDNDNNNNLLKYVGHRSYRYDEDWDGGGQVGGKPSWLVPRRVPEPLLCKRCRQQMPFICQIYAPLDDGDDESFHRTLYVFACPSCRDEAVGSVRVLRATLPEANPYYPALGSSSKQNDDNTGNNISNDDEVIEEVFTPSAAAADNSKSTDDVHVGWNKHLPETWKTPLCAVCGMLGRYRCPLQNKRFCSRRHQIEYKRYGEKINSASGEDADDEVRLSRTLPSLYPVYELVVETEPEPDGEVVGAEHHVEDSDDDDPDHDLEQDDLNAIVRGGASSKRNGNRNNKDVSQDPVTMAFYRRIQDRANVRDQCLRYCRWPPERQKQQRRIDEGEVDGGDRDDGAILWIRSDHRPPVTISSPGGAAPSESVPPPCPYCHAPRKFEFQLMPQLLHYLLLGGRDGGKSKGTNKQNNSGAGDVSKSEEYESFKAALRQADEIIETVSPEAIPPALVEAKDAAVERIRTDLLGVSSSSADGEKRPTLPASEINGVSSDDGNYGHRRHDLNELDWGVVAVYTCTASCSGGDGDALNSCDDDGGLGMYREEFAWRQPSLDS